MPEIPHLELYRAALETRVVGQKLERVRLGSPFLVRSVEPPLASTFGHVVRGTRRVGKRLVFELDNELFIVIHLMIAGRFQWKAAGAKLPGRAGLAASVLDLAGGVETRHAATLLAGVGLGA